MSKQTLQTLIFVIGVVLFFELFIALGWIWINLSDGCLRFPFMFDSVCISVFIREIPKGLALGIIPCMIIFCGLNELVDKPKGAKA